MFMPPARIAIGHRCTTIDSKLLTKKGTQSLAEAFKDVSAKFLVISISSDWLYPSFNRLRIEIVTYNVAP